MEIEVGDVLEIGSSTFTVLVIRKEIDRYDSETSSLVGEHLEVQMHKKGSSSIMPTHVLKLYHKEEMHPVLCELGFPAPPKWLEHPKQRGNVREFVSNHIISLNNIKKIN